MKRLVSAKTVVVKVGSSTLTTPEGQIDARYLTRLAAQLSETRHSRRNVVLVTSGAVRAGLSALGLNGLKAGRRLDVPEKQAAAAVGQSLLMHTYSQAFARFDQKVAQILLTRDDMEDRERFLNARNTLHTLFHLDILPIVNENDSVAVEEIQFGDNDTLAALVALLVDADLLVLLSDVDGFYPDALPERQEEVSRTVAPVAQIDRITPEIERQVKRVVSEGGTGGMYTKLEAARKVTKSGVSMVIANGRSPHVITRLLAGEQIGTFFPAQTDDLGKGKLSSRKRWIAFGRKPRGVLVVNEGARRSIVERGKSLLPVGLTEVHGRFERGEMVSISETVSGEFARGLVNYGSDDLHRIAGLKSAQIERVLGYRDFDEVVHRDNLARTDVSDMQSTQLVDEEERCQRS